MRKAADYGTDLQRELFQAYKTTQVGDESLGRALAAADRTPDSNQGSDSLVQAYRSGDRTASIGGLEVMLDHLGVAAGPVLNVLCRRYGFEAVRLPESARQATPARRAFLLLGAVVGDIQGRYADATCPDGEDGTQISSREANALVGLVDRGIGQLMELRAWLVARNERP